MEYVLAVLFFLASIVSIIVDKTIQAVAFGFIAILWFVVAITGKGKWDD